MSTMTPGPWVAEINREGQNNTVRANNRTVCTLPGFGNPDILEANARAIAAGPDLIAALERICRLEENTHESLRWDMVKAICNAALAKLEG